MEDSDVEMALTAYREQMRVILSHFARDEAKRLEKWEDEQAMLKAFVGALEETQRLIRVEMAGLQELVTTLHGDTVEDETKLGYRSGQDGTPPADDTLERARRKMAAVGTELAQLRETLRSIDSQGEAAKRTYFDASHADERSIWEAQIIALQDTRRMYLSEIDAMEQELHSLDRFVHVERQRRKAQACGWSDLSRLQQQLTVTEAKIDRAKQKLYFPEVKGYRFTAGGNKVYAGAKDLYVGEFSGAFVVSAETNAQLSDGEPVTRLVIQMGGATMLGPNRRHHKAQTATTQSQQEERACEDGSAPPRSPSQDEIAIAQQDSAPSPAGDADDGIAPSPAKQTVAPEPMRPSPHEYEPSSTSTAVVASDSHEALPTAKANPADAVHSRSSTHDLEHNQSADSHASSILLEEQSSVDAEAVGLEAAATAELPSSSGGRRRSLKNKLNTFAVKLSSKTKQPLRKGRFHFKGGAGDDGEVGMAVEAAAPQGGSKLGQKFSASFMATKNLGGGESGGLGARMRRSHGQGTTRGRVQDLSALSASISERAVAAEKGVEVAPSPPAPFPVDGANEASSSSHVSPLPSAPLAVDQPQTTRDEPERSEVDGDMPEDGDPEVLAAINSPLAGNSPSLNRRRSCDSSSSDCSSAGASQSGSREDAARRPTWRESATSTHRVGEGGAALPQRRGVYIVLRGENVELVGEKGTKVPNTTAKEVTLEVECSLRISLEFSRLKGWQAAKAVEFEVLSLHTKTKGNSMPLPKTLIKTLLNVVLPKVVKRSILPAMPKELGEYLLDSAAGVSVGGEVVIQGPPLQALTVDLSLSKQTERQSAGFGLSKRRALASSHHLPLALALLRLDEEQAAVLAEMFSDQMPTILGSGGGGLSILDLCRFYCTYRCYPALWHTVSSVLGKALSLLLRSREAAPLPGCFTFGQWIDEVVAPLVKKQVRVQFALQKLDININCDMALSQVAEYFRRTVREVHAKGGGGSQAGPPVPLEEALSNLDTWESSLVEQLRRFKARFQEMAGSVVASADSGMFAIGLDKLRYVGPLSIKVPLQVDIDDDGALNWDLKVPKRSFPFPFFTPNPITSSDGTLGNGEGTLGDPHGAPDHSSPTHPIFLTDATDERALTGNGGEWENGPRTLGTLLDAAAGSGGIRLRALSSAEILAELEPEYLARLVVNRLSCRVEPNEAALAEMFISRDAALAATTVAAMMRDLLKLEFKPAVDTATGEERYLLQMKTGRMTRTVLEVESLGLQSPLSPADALRLVHSIAREVVAAWTPGDSTVRQLLDERFQAVHAIIAREMLAICCCIEARAKVGRASSGTEGRLEKQLLLRLSGATSDGSQPLFITNEVDLVPLMETLFEAPEIGA